jgi:putative transposase
MNKIKLVNQFTKSIVKKIRKKEVSSNQITSTLINAALNKAFVNESCKSTGQISKSQVIYRKVKRKPNEIIQEYFRENTIKFLRSSKIYSRNHRFLISSDTTKEPFYGDVSKAEDKMYLHRGSIAPGSKYYYEYLTISITCDVQARYILDGVIVPVGCYIEDYVEEMVKFVREYLPIEMFLFDRGFSSWGVIHKLKKLRVPYLIFWEKQGKWYHEHFEKLKEGEILHINRNGIYNRDKTNHKVNSSFVLIKQLEYEEKKYDWIFATNTKLKNAASYVKRYKKRWGIETIYRVTDDLRIYTTSTNSIIRYFLFMFTCLVYNIWKFFQMFLGRDFTLANYKTNMIIFMAKYGMIYPKHYDRLEAIAMKFFNP